MKLSASGDTESRRKVCKDFEKYVSTNNAATLLIRNDRDKIEAIRACQSSQAVQAGTSQSIKQERRVTIGSGWSSLQVGPENSPVLIDETGEAHEPGGSGMFDSRVNALGKIEVRLRPFR